MYISNKEVFIFVHITRILIYWTKDVRGRSCKENFGSKRLQLNALCRRC